MSSTPHLMQEAASEFKSHTEAKIAALGAELAALTGKEHHHDRAERGRAIAALRMQSRYIDACRVAKGLPPVHGFFAGGSLGNNSSEGGSVLALEPEQAARLAAEAEQALQELEPKAEEKRHVVLPEQGLPADCEDSLFSEWERRMARLEAKVGPQETDLADIDELQSIAQEVVDHKERLHHACGYRKRDLKADPQLHRIEDRLDALAAALLPDLSSAQQGAEAGAALDTVVAVPSTTAAAHEALGAAELKQRARELAAKMVHRHEKAVGLSPSETREVEKLLVEITDLKAKLTAEGLTEHEQDKDERVFTRLLRVSELRQKEHHDKRHDQHRHYRSDRGCFGELRGELEQLRSDFALHKRRLRDERGYSPKDLRHDPDVAELEERLTALHKFGGA
mmetsp:Transcript_132516/g.369441  ORF Transcript_132516/g.369441 Transcript_132516/m.369441 type:complete len:396 (-) Transcript_132516:359-1546(-)